MKLKTGSFEAENLRTARFILQNEAKYGPDGLLVQWALLVSERARTDAAPDPEAQRQLFETGAAA